MRPQSDTLSVSLEELGATADEYLRSLSRLGVGYVELVTRYLGLHQMWPELQPYSVASPSVRAVTDEVRAKGGEDALLLFQKTALSVALRDTLAALPLHTRWRHSEECFRDAAARIVRGLNERTIDSLDYPNDFFAKDIALATGRLWHAKAQVIEPRSGVARAQLLRAGTTTALRGMKLLMQIGGHAPMYEMHTYHNLLHWFTEGDWEECYRMIAIAMESDPQVKGVVGTAWFFDEEVGRISPRLAYLRDFPANRGGRFLKANNTPSGMRSAIAKSETRRRLYEEGKYKPQEYLLIWPRADILQWLQSERSQASERPNPSGL